MGDEVLKYNSSIIVDKTSEKIEYTTSPDFLYTDGVEMRLNIIGFSWVNDMLTVNFNVDNPIYGGSPGKLQANLTNKRLQFVDWSMDGRGNSAVYNFEFQELYESGDKILLAGEYEVNVANNWANIIGLGVGRKIQFSAENNSCKFINSKGVEVNLFCKKVVTNSESSIGILTSKEGDNLGDFILGNDSFNFNFLNEKVEIKMSISKYQVELNRKKEEKENEKRRLENLIDEKIKSKDFIAAATLYVNNNIDNFNLYSQISSGLKNTSVNKTPTDEDLKNLISSVVSVDSFFLSNSKYYLLDGSSYKLISNSKKGLYIIDTIRNHEIFLSKNACSEKIGSLFSVTNEFEKYFSVKFEFQLTGIGLNPQWKGQLQSGDKTMRFFLARKKEDLKFIGGVKDTPPSKYIIDSSVPFKQDLSNVYYFKEIELKKAVGLYDKKIFVNNIFFGLKSNVARKESYMLDLDWYY
jgi:hypothetical protein